MADTRLSVNISQDVAREIKELTARKDISVTELIRLALTAYKFIDDEQSKGHHLLVERKGVIKEVKFT